MTSSSCSGSDSGSGSGSGVGDVISGSGVGVRRFLGLCFCGFVTTGLGSSSFFGFSFLIPSKIKHIKKRVDVETVKYINY